MGTDKVDFPRVVLDTYCLISALVFSGAVSTRFSTLWQTQRILPVICPETHAELQEVLAYPKFALSTQMQTILLSEFIPFAECLPSIQPMETIPELAEPDDAKFIRLAQRARTDYLVSGDKHILRYPMPSRHCISSRQPNS